MPTESLEPNAKRVKFDAEKAPSGYVRVSHGGGGIGLTHTL